MTPWPWAELMPDPRDWVAASDDPAARWVLLTGVLDHPDDHADSDPDVASARAQMLAHPDTADLLDRLEPWDRGGPLSGHNQLKFAPNLLGLLADRGLRPGDDPRVDGVVEQMLEHQDDDGRFMSCAALRGQEAPAWGTLPCDNHAIVETLIRYGRADDPRVRTALDTTVADLTDTAQGRAWLCRPDPGTRFRGPGRKADMCPQVTLEALRAISRLPDDRQPPGLLDVARIALGCWRRRGTENPYMFGHGKGFKTSKWPVTWYCAQQMLDALGRYPALWRGPDAEPQDRRSLAEVAACLVAYNTDGDGRVTPRSVYRGQEQHSFGQKKVPSAFATAQVLTVLHRLDDLAGDAAAVDVARLGSAKGGTGTARPPTPPR